MMNVRFRLGFVRLQNLCSFRDNKIKEKKSESCPVFPATLTEEAVFSPLYILASFIKDGTSRWPGENRALPSKPQGKVQPPHEVLLLASEEVAEEK
ncbi:uncharacterized protein AAG666_015455 isoform 2-T6 [Megaptera novaeangliae]